jgi:hypothetical protein
MHSPIPFGINIFHAQELVSGGWLWLKIIDLMLISLRLFAMLTMERARLKLFLMDCCMFLLVGSFTQYKKIDNDVLRYHVSALIRRSDFRRRHGIESTT